MVSETGIEKQSNTQAHFTDIMLTDSSENTKENIIGLNHYFGRFHVSYPKSSCEN